MESIDVFSIFISGFTVGLIGAHYLNKHELKLAYDRGVMDTVWAIQVHGMREHLSRLFGVARDKTADRADSGNGPV